MKPEAVEKEKVAPQQGQITIGITLGGQVVIMTPGPETFFTPQQARDVAKIIVEKANDAEKTQRRRNN